MRKRVITALVLLGIGAVVIGWGGWALWCWVWLLSMVSVYELVGMFAKSAITTYPSVAYSVVTAALVSLKVWPMVWTSWAGRLLALGVVGGCLFELWRRQIWLPRSKWGATLRVVVFILGTFPFIYLLREGQNGLVMMLMVMGTIWTTDTLALVGGKRWGRRALSGISPNKTMEGTLIGVVSGSLMAMLVSLVAARSGHPIPSFLGGIHGWLGGIGWGVWIASLSQIGDLHESLVKRRLGVKDSSDLLPGHGGVYDRADSTLLVVPLAYWLVNA